MSTLEPTYPDTLTQRWHAATADGVSLALDYPETTLPERLSQTISEFSSNTALEFFGRTTTYAELGHQISAFAGVLRDQGVTRGDNVALIMPNCPQHVVAFYATLSLGATVIEHNPLATTGELTPMFADHGADVAIIWDSIAATIEKLPDAERPSTVISVNMTAAMRSVMRWLLTLPLGRIRATRAQLTTPAPGTLSFDELLKDAIADAPTSFTSEASPDDIALVLYTSGTTGSAKGVPLTHLNLLASGTQAIEWVHDLVPGKEVFMACLPFFHVFGASLSLNAGLMIGAVIELVPKPDVTLILQAIKRRTPTMLIAVPPVFEKVADQAPVKKISLKGIRTGISGAMPLNGELISTWEGLTGGFLIEGYGLSECSPIVAGNPVGPGRKAGSIGIPFPDTQVRLTDPEDPSRDVGPGEVGEVLVKGPQVFSGYRNRPEETAAAFHDGWFRTGDIVSVDEEGYLRVVDRIKELIITGGFNVYPSEVEDVLRLEEHVLDAAVVGVRGAGGREEVVAALVLSELDTIDPHLLRNRVKERLSAYKVPRRFVVLPELPRNPMGKVLRREVRAALEQREHPDSLIPTKDGA